MERKSNGTKDKQQRRGRPSNPRFDREALKPLLREECRRRFEKSTGLAWNDVADDIDRFVERYKSEIAVAFDSPDSEPCAALMNAMEAAIEKTAGSNTPFAVWVKANVQSLLERDQHSLTMWAFQVRKEPGSMVSQFVEALDYLNFLARLDRPGSTEELACILILKGIDLPKIGLASVGEIIGLVAKTVHKARDCHGMVRLIERHRREREQLLDPDGTKRTLRERDETSRRENLDVGEIVRGKL